MTATNLKVRETTLVEYRALWRQTQDSLPWSNLCMLPPWIESWVEALGPRADLYICSFSSADTVIGVAPLQIQGRTARLIGDADVCDYLDFVVQPDAAEPFFDALFGRLRRDGITALELRAQRPDAAIRRTLEDHAARLDCDITCKVEDESYEVELPATWSDYLHLLRGKDRHEIRRKDRRMHEAGKVSLRTAGHPRQVERSLPVFLDLFTDHRVDKIEFMTEPMTVYFENLARAASREGLLKLMLVELDDDPAAAVMMFDYRGTRYLYNNGYAQRYRSLSVGHLSKVYSIREGIANGMRRYDFLKGSEPYKRRLGGKAIPIYRCRVSL